MASFRPRSLFVAALAALLLLSLPQTAYAQGPPGGLPAGAAAMMGQVSGQVLDDATGDPVPLATVALYRGGEFITGAASNPDGTFEVGPLRPGSYEVRVSSVGYTSRMFEEVAVRPGSPTALGTIRMGADTALLGEAVVEGARELVETRADRTVYNVADQPVTAGGSAIEVLQTLPAVEVDLDGNIALRGNQNVAVHINGRPVPIRGDQLAAFLRQLPSDQVARVEVLPNPSARYEADSMGGIINIVLKQGVNRGLSGGVTVGGGTAPSANASGNLAYQVGRVDAYASYGFRYDDNFSDGGTFRQNLFADPAPAYVFLDQVSGSERSNLSHVFNTTLDYTLRPGLNLIAQGLLSSRAGTTENATFYRFLDPGQAEISTLTYDRLSEGDISGLNANATLGLRRVWTPQRHELSVESRYSFNRSNNEDLFTQTGNNPIVQRDDLFARTGEAIAQADYVRPVGGGRIEAGGRASLRHIENDRVGQTTDPATGVAAPDLGRTNAFTHDENVFAAYLQGAQPLGPVEVQLGVRAEHSATDFELATGGETFERSYTDLFPSAYVSYAPWQGSTLRAGYSRRINRPRAQQLNPFTSFTDPLNVRRGNPDLRPEYVDSFELAASQFLPIGSVSLTPFYRRTTNVIRPRILFDRETGVSTMTMENLDVDDSYGADLTLAARFGQTLGGFVSTSVYRTVTSAGNIESGLGTDALAWSLRGNLTSRIRPGLDVQAFAFWRSPMQAVNGRISSFAMSSIGLRQQLMGQRANLSLRVNDPFNTMRFEFRSADANYEQVGFNDPQFRRVDLTFTYTFGQVSQQQRRRGQQQDQPQVPQDDFGF